MTAAGQVRPLPVPALRRRDLAGQQPLAYLGELGGEPGQHGVGRRAADDAVEQQSRLCLHLRVGRAAAITGRPMLRLLTWHNWKYRTPQNCARVSCISE